MLRSNFIRCSYDSCVYLKMKNHQVLVYLLLYVDDMLIASGSLQDIQEFKQQLNSEFEMKDLGEAKRILGMEIIRDRKNKKLFLTQSTQLKKVVQKFNMHEAKEVSIPLGQHFKLSAKQSPTTPEEANDMVLIPYSNGVGSIMQSMVCSRLDPAHAISVVSRLMANPRIVHWETLKWLLRYIKGSVNLCLVFGKQESSSKKLAGYVDADFFSEH